MFRSFRGIKEYERGPSDEAYYFNDKAAHAALYMTRARAEGATRLFAGKVKLKVSKLLRQTFETPIIERYRRRESSVEAALIEMYLAGISVRRVEDITQALWGTRVSPRTVSNLNKKIYAKIEAWRNWRIEGEHRISISTGS